MSPAERQPGWRVATAELQPVLEGLLNGSDRRIARLERTPSPYGSSYALEEIAVCFEDGERLDLMFKNCSPRALSPTARRVKPEFLDDPLREIEVYRNLLDGRQLGTASYYGSVVEEAADRYWLFLEKVAGRELCQVGQFDVWKKVARWLAGLHAELEGSELPAPVGKRLVRCDADYYGLWLERAISILGAVEANRENKAGELVRQLSKCHGQVIRELSGLPGSPIHGEFYASNVLVQNAGGRVRVCPVDWERAAIGPGLVDLAALTAGKWSEEQKNELAREYFAAIHSLGNKTPDWDESWRGWQLCRLHLAVQWLGWSPDWSPPPEHRQDWLAEAASAATNLGYRG